MPVTKTPYDLVVIGGGFAGLAAAHEALKSGKSVCIVESSLNAGGLASGAQQASFWSIDKFYHHWFGSDKHIFSFLSELNLEMNIIKCSVKTGVLTDRGIFKLDGVWPLLRFPLFNILSKLRLLIFLAICYLPLNTNFLHRFTAKHFICTICGKKVYDVLWSPLLRSKFEKYEKDISAAWIYKKINLRSKNASGNGETLYYYKGGFQKCVDDIVSILNYRNCNFLFGAKVEKVTKCENLFHLKCLDGSEIAAKKILISSRRSAIALMEKFFPYDVKATYKNFKSMANVCVILPLTVRLSDFYWLSNCSSSSDWVAVIEHTNLVSSDFYEPDSLIYLSRYVSPENQFYKMPNDELIKNAIDFISLHFPHVSRDRIYHDKCIVNRALDTQPVITSCEKAYSFPHIFDGWGVLAMEQIFPEDRGTNYAVREGKRVYHGLMETEM